MQEKFYMYITDSSEHFSVSSYTKFITTLDSFTDMFVEVLAKEEDLLPIEDLYQYSLSKPDEKGCIKITISGLDFCGEYISIERGLIPVKCFK